MAAPKLRIGVDLDDVCIEFIHTLIDCYNEDISEFGRICPQVSYDDFTSWDLVQPEGPLEFDSYDELWDWVTDRVLEAWAEAPQVPGARDALRALAAEEHHLVCITSKARDHQRVAYEAVANHCFPFDEIHVTGDKVAVPRCDVYIDDSPKHLEALTNAYAPDSLVIRFDRPWNRPGQSNATADTWKRVLQLIEDWQNPALVRPDQPLPTNSLTDLGVVLSAQTALSQHQTIIKEAVDTPRLSARQARTLEEVAAKYDRPTLRNDDEEIRVTDPKTGGQKGQKLARLGAIDPVALLEIAKVAGYGAQKYAAFNYLKGYDWSLSFDAMQRHLLQFWAGEDYDTESGRLHVAHAAWHGGALTSFILRGLGTDDRFRA